MSASENDLRLARQLRSNTFFHDGFRRSPTIGLHAAYFKVVADRTREAEGLLRGGERRDRIFESDPRAYERLHRTYRCLGREPAGDPPDEAFHDTSLFATLGYWDWLTIEYVNDFAGLTRVPSTPFILGEKSFYGYLLATNSSVVDGRVMARPFATYDEENRRGEPVAGVFAHYKMNPLLLFAGCSDLLLESVRFLALLIEAPGELWQSDLARRAWQRALAPMQSASRDGQALEIEEIEALLEPVIDDARGVEFIAYQNLGWDDLSVYLMGPRLEALARLAFFLRELPTFFARWAGYLAAATGTASTGTAAMGTARPESINRDGATLHELIERCRSLRRQSNASPNSDDAVDPRALAAEFPIFCDYTNIFTLTRRASDGVRYLRTFNAKPGRLRALTASLDRGEADAHQSLEILSGPVDLLSCLDRDHSPGFTGGDASDAFISNKKLTALLPLQVAGFYRPRLDRGSIFDSMRLLFEQRFGHTDWDRAEKILYRLGVPRNTRQSLRNLVLSHLAFKADPVMVNSLFDFLRLWRNLERQLLDELGKINAGRDPDRQLIKNLFVFVDKIAQAIGTRYHASSRMFEVVELNPIHRGGVDVFLNAYSQLRYLALAAFRFLDRESHEGIVNVGYGNTARVYNLFGSVIELDWLRLSNPENGFIILHELGHQILRDKITAPLARTLQDARTWSSITRLGRYQQVLDPASRWSSLETVQGVFADVFGDLFMLTILRRSLAGQPARQEEIGTFYDRWFWTHAEVDLHHRPKVGDGYLYLLLVRWYCVRQVIDHWPAAEFALGREQKAELESLLAWLEEGRRNEAAAQDAALDRQGDGFLEYRIGTGGSPPPRAFAFRPETELLGVTIVEMPASQEDWRRLLEEQVARYSRAVAARLHPRMPCRDDCGCSAPPASRLCRRFFDDAYGLLASYLRPVERQENTAQFFILLAMSYLDVLLRDDDESAATLTPIRDMFALAQDLFDSIFAAGPLASHARFDADGRLAGRGAERYAPAIVNPRGSIILCDMRLRHRAFGERLAIFDRLAADRLARLASELAGHD